MMIDCMAVDRCSKQNYFDRMIMNDRILISSLHHIDNLCIRFECSKKMKRMKSFSIDKRRREIRNCLIIVGQ